MKKNYLTAAIALLGVLAFFAALGWAGDMDYTEQCILRMSYDEYDTIKARLTQLNGSEPSERDIAHWWTEHQK